MISEYSMAVQAPVLCGYENQLGFSADWMPMIQPPPPPPVYSNAAAAVTFAADGFPFPNQTMPLAPMIPHQEHDHQLLPLSGFHDFQRAMVVGVDPLMSVNGDDDPSSSSIYHGATAINSWYGGTGTQQPSSSMSLAAEVDFQRREIDLFLKVQSERLRYAIQEQRKRQMELLLEKIESRAATMMREKEQQLETARSKRRELEEWLRRADAEKEAWEKAAKEKEATVMELEIMIQEAKQKQRILLAISSSSMKNGAETEAVDAESACECDYSPSSSSLCDLNSRRRGGEAGAEDEKWRGRCRVCNGGGACMVFLPCRHLCSCKSCEGILQLCPVCHSLKQGNIEVFLSLVG